MKCLDECTRGKQCGTVQIEIQIILAMVGIQFQDTMKAGGSYLRSSTAMKEMKDEKDSVKG